MKDKLPIWLATWTFKNKTGSIRKVERTIVKGENAEAIMNNEVLINRALKRIKGLRKNHTFVPSNVELISQHGYGPAEQEGASIFKR